jgi:hypothetical protein
LNLDWGCSSVVEHLPSMWNVPGSISRSQKIVITKSYKWKKKWKHGSIFFIDVFKIAYLSDVCSATRYKIFHIMEINSIHICNCKLHYYNTNVNSSKGKKYFKVYKIMTRNGKKYGFHKLTLPLVQFPGYRYNVRLKQVEFCFFVPFGGTGVWIQGFTLAKQMLFHFATHQPRFMLGIFKIGSHELFAQAGFKPQSSSLLHLE